MPPTTIVYSSASHPGITPSRLRFNLIHTSPHQQMFVHAPPLVELSNEEDGLIPEIAETKSPCESDDERETNMSPKSRISGTWTMCELFLSDPVLGRL